MTPLETEFARPNPRQLRRCLPTDRRHLFLRLMPFSEDAPSEYRELQTLVYHCLSNRRHDLRVLALEQLVALCNDRLELVPDREKLLIEIASLVGERVPSFVCAEVDLEARLAVTKIVIAERRVQGKVVGVPELVGDLRWVKGKLFGFGGEVMLPLEQAVGRLTAIPNKKLSTLPETERKAAIRLLRLFLVYGPAADGSAPAQSRCLFFQQLGLPVWHALLERGFKNSDADPGIYGKPSMQRIWLALQASPTNPQPQDVKESRSVRRSSQPAPVTAPPGLPNSFSLAPENAVMHTFITERIPEPQDSDARASVEMFKALCEPMPVAKLPSRPALDQMRTQLRAEFPWAHEAIDVIFDDLRARSMFGSVRLGFSPILLNGPGGCGKSRIAQRIAEVMGIECFSMSLAGLTDSMAIQGTARGWRGEQASPLLQPLLKGCATVVMCMDELDKANGAAYRNEPAAALLSLLEPGEARRWRDIFLQVEIDLTPLLWIFTSNSTTHLSAPLRSRLRILEIEQPTRAQMLEVVPYLIRDIEREWGLPKGALDGFEVSAQAIRPVRTMRGLRRAVTIAARTWLDGLNPTLH